MSETAIEVVGLSKLYHLGEKLQYRTLRDTIADAVTAPFRRGLLSAGRKDNDPKSPIWVLDDVSFEVKKGEVLGIIGRNGAGKSTLLKILSRITEPTKGYANICGTVRSLLEVGTGFHAELTGRENIYLNGAILGMKRADIASQFDSIVSFAGVEDFVDTPVKWYSSGMYLRLAFAVAAHLRSDILIVDEVLAVGDSEFQKKCIGKMHEVSSDGRTVLFVSHNIHAIDQVSSTCLVLAAGRVRQIGHVKSVIADYLRSIETGGSGATWINEGHSFNNPWFTPYRFALADEDGEPLSMPIRNDQPVFVYIEGHIQKSDPALSIGYSMFTSDGQLLYSSYQTDQKIERWPTLTVGLSMLRSRIPSHFLAECSYRLELIVTFHCREWICQPGVNAPVIRLTIEGGSSDSPYWRGRRSGIIAPLLAWESCPSSSSRNPSQFDVVPNTFV